MKFAGAALLLAALASTPAPAQIEGTMVAPGCDSNGRLVRITIGDSEIAPVDDEDTVFRVRNAIGRDSSKLWLLARDEMPFGCVQQAIALIRKAGGKLKIDFIDGPKGGD
jgi:hypothetical protein